MIRRKFKTSTADFGTAGIGEGVLQLTHLLDAPGELYGAGRVFAHASLPEGAWVGPHVHTGETEIYYFLSGQGDYYDNGQWLPVEPGAAAQVVPGEQHGLKNTGNGPLEYICLVLYTEEVHR